jgi:hypothetical protein
MAMSSLPATDEDILREALGLAWDSDRDRESDREAIAGLFEEHPLLEERCQHARESYHRDVEKLGAASWRDVRSNSIERDIYGTRVASDEPYFEELDPEEIHEQIDERVN